MTIKFALGLAGLALSALSQPALANETAAAAQISGAIEVDTANKTTGDSEFQQLFASWRNLETKGTLAVVPRQSVSVPTGMPVGGVRLTSDYGMRNHPVLQTRRQHNGVDLAGATGTPVYATGDGFVSKADAYGSYGNYVQIEHGGEMQTRYAHLSGYAVSNGQRVLKGQLIGYVGSTGRSTGPHLHYEVRVGGEPVDPRPYMTTRLAVVSNGGGQGGPE